MLAAVIQAFSALVSVGAIKKVHYFEDGKPFIELDLRRLPYLGGGLCVLLTHLLLFAVFFQVASTSAAIAEVNAHAFHLPEVGTEELLAGELAIDAGTYLSEARDWFGAVSRRPVLGLLILYISAALFAPLKLTVREWLSGAFALLLLGCVVYIAAGFGVGFRAFSRGWWATMYYFPEWWEIFSLFVTLALLCLVTVTTLRLGAFTSQLAFGRETKTSGGCGEAIEEETPTTVDP